MNFFLYLLNIRGFICLDIFNFINLQDSSVYWFSFYWTNANLNIQFFFYIYILLYYIIGLVLNIEPRYVIFCIIFFYIYNYTGFFFTNNSLNMFNAAPNSTMDLLYNNINKIHPLLFYTSVLFFFLSPTILRFSNLYLFSKLTGTSLTALLVSLFLGSLWAFQENTWGGWWNWDPSEFLGLLIFIFLLISIHIHMGSCFYTYTFFALSFLIIVSSYLFLQLNFALTSHNFGLRNLFFFNNSIFNLIILFVLITYTSLLLYDTITMNNNFFQFYKYLIIPLVQIQAYPFIAFFPLSYFFYSFLSIFVSFFWDFFGIIFFNIGMDLLLINISLWLLLSFFFNPKVPNFPTPSDNFMLYYFFEFNMRRRYTVYLHLPLLLSFLFSTLDSLFSLQCTKTSLIAQTFLNLNIQGFTTHVSFYFKNNWLGAVKTFSFVSYNNFWVLNPYTYTLNISETSTSLLLSYNLFYLIIFFINFFLAQILLSFSTLLIFYIIIIFFKKLNI